MAKIVLSVMVMLFLVGLAATAYCDGPTDKLGRGFSNLLTFPCEVPNRIKEEYQKNGITAAWSYGILKGIFYAGARALVGAYEIVSFPVPIPGDFQPILTDPEYFFETP
jgi:putative exosortase-associated protein (TIGR04073 family)